MGNFKAIVKLGFVVYTLLLGFSSFASKNVDQLTIGINKTPALALRGRESKAQDVRVEDNTLTFDLNLEGQIVSVSINAEGDKISGKASSQDGVFQLTGERRLDPE